MDMVPGIPTVSKKPASIVYGPLTEDPVDPDVVLLRVNLDPREDNSPAVSAAEVSVAESRTAGFAHPTTG